MVVPAIFVLSLSRRSHNRDVHRTSRLRGIAAGHRFSGQPPMPGPKSPAPPWGWHRVSVWRTIPPTV